MGKTDIHMSMVHHMIARKFYKGAVTGWLVDDEGWIQQVARVRNKDRPIGPPLYPRYRLGNLVLTERGICPIMGVYPGVYTGELHYRIGVATCWTDILEHLIISRWCP